MFGLGLQLTLYTVVLAYKQPLLYNLAVARELLKHVYRAENLQPPSIATIRSAYGTIWSRATSLPYWREAVRSREIVRLGIYGVEAYTIFKVTNGFRLFPSIPQFYFSC